EAAPGRAAPPAVPGARRQNFPVALPGRPGRGDHDAHGHRYPGPGRLRPVVRRSAGLRVDPRAVAPVLATPGRARGHGSSGGRRTPGVSEDRRIAALRGGRHPPHRLGSLRGAGASAGRRRTRRALGGLQRHGEGARRGGEPQDGGDLRPLPRVEDPALHPPRLHRGSGGGRDRTLRGNLGAAADRGRSNGPARGRSPAALAGRGRATRPRSRSCPSRKNRPARSRANAPALCAKRRGPEDLGKRKPATRGGRRGPGGANLDQPHVQRLAPHPAHGKGHRRRRDSRRRGRLRGGGHGGGAAPRAPAARLRAVLQGGQLPLAGRSRRRVRGGSRDLEGARGGDGGEVMGRERRGRRGRDLPLRFAGGPGGFPDGIL
ncbi:MAG: hypothetical protein AVDCRST_MAG55-881, partial [uncultured Rubrobacteraceae bacterium]